MDFPFSESAIIDPNKSYYSGTSPSGKLCIVSTFEGSEREDVYAVFIVDLASSPLPAIDDDDGGGGDFIRTAPTFFLDLDPNIGTFCAVCIFDSTMYLFQSARGDEYFRWKSVYSYDLSPHLQDERDRFEPGTTRNVKMVSEMSSSKYLPQAIPTPDGKRILVFSTQFFYHPADMHPEFIDFELFHPLQKKARSKKKKSLWKKLPSLHEYLKKIDAPSANFFIIFHGFIDSSTFLIHIKFGVFTLDIDMPDPVWQKCGDSNKKFHSYGRVFGIEKDRLLITPSGAFDVSNGYNVMRDPSRFHSFPKLSFGSGFEHEDQPWSDMHTVYDKHGELFGIASLQLGIQKYSNYAHMILDICSFDLDKYRIDKKTVGPDARLETSICKSFKFIIDGEQCYFFMPLCLSPIHQGTK